MAFAVLAAVLALCSVGYYLLCLWSMRSFLHDAKGAHLPEHAAEGGCATAARGLTFTSPARTSFTPAISILKPLRGADPEMYAALRSHCVQDYPAYEIIFGIADSNDPAGPMVERLKQEFPAQPMELVICPLVLGSNLKVSNLVQMLPQARYDCLLVNDSDIRVPSDYLRRICAPLADSQVGMVTSMYRGMAAGFWSRLEALGISTDFFAGVLAARWLQGIHFALGSTLCFSRQTLNEIGGFEPLLDYLADDYELGARIAVDGHQVLLSDVVVDTHLPDYRFRDFWRHQLRWARGVKGARNWGYLGLAVTFGLPWALLALIFSQGAVWAWSLLILVALARLSVALAVGSRILRDPQLLRDLWLLPLRDVLALAIWIASFCGNTVHWRDRRFTLKEGKLISSPALCASISHPDTTEH